MKNLVYLLFILLFQINCNFNSDKKVGIKSYKTFINIDSATTYLRKTTDVNRTIADDRLLLIAFVNRELAKNQKLGWQIIEDSDISKMAKKKYTLVILGVSECKELGDEYALKIEEVFKNPDNNLYFVITNQALSVFGEWTPQDEKESIIEKLQVGSGP